MAKKEMNVGDRSINYEEKNGIEWFNLNHLAEKFGTNKSGESVRSWLRKPDTLNFIEAYEKFNNPDFDAEEMKEVKLDAMNNGRRMSIDELVKRTKSKHLRAKQGRYGGTFATFDIAAHFMMWLSSVFYVWFIGDYKRMKQKEQKELLKMKLWESGKKRDALETASLFENDEFERLKKEYEKLYNKNFE